MTSFTLWITLLVLGALATALLVRKRFALRVTLPILLPPWLVLLLAGLPWLVPTRLPWVVHVTPWLIAPLGAALLIVGLRGRELRERLTARRALLHALGVGLALATIALLLAETEGLTWKNDQARILVWDVSRSAERAGVTSLRRDAELHLAEASMQPGDRLGMVEVAGRAELTLPLHAKGSPIAHLTTDLPRDATDLEAGVLRALAEIDNTGGRIVLVSDGIENHGDVLRAAMQARAREIAIDIVVLDYTPPADIELHALYAPSRAPAAQAFDLRIETATSGDAARTASLVLKRDGQPWQTRRVQIAPGHDVLRVPVREDEAGVHRYEAELLSDEGDAIVENDRKIAFVDVVGAKSAWIVGPNGTASQTLHTWLSAAGFEVHHSGGDELTDVAAFSARDLVVLVDVPARNLGAARLQALAHAVTDVGTGLLLVGGAHAFGPGGYAGTPLEEIAPVTFDLKKDKNKPSLAEVITIDYSGSMSADAGGRSKLDLANEAAARSAALLAPGDRIAVAHVDTEVSWTIPLTVIDGADLSPKIRAVQPGGGGIYTDLALRTAYAALRGTPATELRHVLLFADGADAEQITDCARMAAGALATDHITTSVVSLGRGSDSAELERTSTAGGGRFYLVEDARTLPEVFSQETVMASRRAFREEHVLAQIGADAPYLQGPTPLALPSIDGYVVTLAKPGARLALVGVEDEPLVADWPHGLGRTAVLTTDLGGRWAKAWNGSADAARVVSQLALLLARAPTPPSARVTTSLERGAIRVDAHWANAEATSTLFARVLGPNGEAHELALDEIARGSYEGQVRPRESGTYVVTLVHKRGDGDEQLLARSAIVLGASDELAPRPSNRALLERIAYDTGGTVRITLENLFAGERHYYATHTEWSHGLLLVLAALVVLLVATRRLVLPSLPVRTTSTVQTPAPTAATQLAPLRARRQAPTTTPTPVVIARAEPAATKPDPTPAEGPRALSAAERIAKRRRGELP